MRIRRSTNELCYSLDEFRKLSGQKICRRYGIGDAWVDQEQDNKADEEMDRFDPARC